MRGALFVAFLYTSFVIINVILHRALRPPMATRSSQTIEPKHGDRIEQADDDVGESASFRRMSLASLPGIIVIIFIIVLLYIELC